MWWGSSRRPTRSYASWEPCWRRAMRSGWSPASPSAPALCTNFSRLSKDRREQNHLRPYDTIPEEGAHFSTTSRDSIACGALARRRPRRRDRSLRKCARGSPAGSAGECAARVAMGGEAGRWSLGGERLPGCPGSRPEEEDEGEAEEHPRPHEREHVLVGDDAGLLADQGVEDGEGLAVGRRGVDPPGHEPCFEGLPPAHEGGVVGRRILDQVGARRREPAVEERDDEGSPDAPAELPDEVVEAGGALHQRARDGGEGRRRQRNPQEGESESLDHLGDEDLHRAGVEGEAAHEEARQRAHEEPG